jgi:hypothetical protein
VELLENLIEGRGQRLSQLDSLCHEQFQAADEFREEEGKVPCKVQGGKMGRCLLATDITR